MSNTRVARYFDSRAHEYDKHVHAYYTARRREELGRRANGLILEVGSGSGVLTPALAAKGRVIGLDIAPAMIARAVARTGIAGALADAQLLPFKNNSFDTVVCSEVIHYLENRRKFCEEGYRVLRPGGKILIMVINAQWRLLDRTRDGMNAVFKLFGKQYGWSDPCYAAGLRAEELSQLLLAAGFSDVRTQGFIFFPAGFMHSVNKYLERTWLNRFAIAHLAEGVKR